MRFRKVVRIGLLGLLIALVGAISYFAVGFSGYQFKIGDVAFRGADADLTINKVHVVQNIEGEPGWELWADSAKVYRGKNLTLLKNLRLRFYPKNNETAKVTARQGTIQNKTQNIGISGDVVIMVSNGVSMKMDSLRFRPMEKRIESDAPVLIEGPRFRVSGTGMRGQTDLGYYELKENVSAASLLWGSAFSYGEKVLRKGLAADKRYPLRITSKKMEASSQRNLVAFIGNVKANQGEMRIYANRIEVYTREGKQANSKGGTTPLDGPGKVDRIVAIGNVRMEEAKRRFATAGRLEYRESTGVAVLTGNPRAWEGKNQIVGSKIELNLREDKTIVHGSSRQRVNVTLSPSSEISRDKKSN